MIRGLLRLLGLSSFAAMLVCAIIDLIDSSGGGATIFQPLGVRWLRLHDTSLQDLYETLTAEGPSWLWSSALLPILSQPAIFVFGCLAALFLAMAWLLPGRRRRRRAYDPRQD